MHRPIRAGLVAAGLLTTLSGCSPEPEAAAPVEAEGYGQTQQGERAYDPGAGWSLSWQDDFTGTSLNTGAWNVLTSNWDPLLNNCNFGTGGLEFPRAQNVTVGNGKLVITAERTGDNPTDSHCPGNYRSFYSGRIHTKGKVEGRYGKIVASIKIPPGYGMWPAFWTLGANVQSAGWPGAGEIDILEWKSTEPTWMKSALHWYNGGNADWGTGASRGVDLSQDFHTYEVEWTANSMVFRLDKDFVSTATFNHNETEFQQNHYLILNLALGGVWYGNPAPASIDLPFGARKTMEVEWVRWYQPGGSQSLGLTNAGFESGMTGWNTWSPNGTAAAAFSETYNGGHSGSFHLTHWTSAAAYEAWTYQTKTGLASGNYKLRAWFRKGGTFDFARFQVKTCGDCAAAITNLGTYGNYTLLETPAVNVTNGYLEFGLHSKSPAHNGSNFIHMDDVELIKL
ncbi:glycoside hydrolase family 16 protein [Corallococcus carmarthensis]|uniref:glycoside hydrolase family 16 protein n=1 Tax=Corallococcus carmarthensis TaxID=2316728 RepID=UPI00148BBE5D|nr:glycoside hydrolase family 16 protein [Corallococcus carmarthensis]NOK17664.1 glycoside hydrolase family 16 protein [Corallococcus carmarthensis]